MMQLWIAIFSVDLYPVGSVILLHEVDNLVSVGPLLGRAVAAALTKVAG